jgi:hypothetical protein
MSSDDASDFLNEMAQGNPQNVNEFRLMTTSLEKALGKIKAKKQSRKLGRYEMGTIYRIQPSMRQCDNAVKVLASSGKTSKSAERFAVLKDISIPMFSAKGLIMTRASGEVRDFYILEFIKSLISIGIAFDLLTSTDIDSILLRLRGFERRLG